MGVIGVAPLTLNEQRSKLKRQVYASWWSCVLGLTFVLIALGGTIAMDPFNLILFLLYVFVTCMILFGMFERVRLLRMVAYFGQRWPRCG